MPLKDRNTRLGPRICFKVATKTSSRKQKPNALLFDLQTGFM
jgi:hypothetical protein